MREAERLLQQMLNTGRELVAQYRRGQIEESRRGLGQLDGYGEQFVNLLQKLGTGPGPLVAAA